MSIRSWSCVCCAMLTLLISCNCKPGDYGKGIPTTRRTKTNDNAAPLKTDWPLSKEASVSLQKHEAQRLKIPTISRLNLGDKVGIDLVLIPPGVFPMGSESSASEGNPPHLVKISRGFLMGRYAITWQQYLRVVNLKDVDLATRISVEKYIIPEKRMGWVANVDWVRAKLFCDKLSNSQGVKARIATEAEWEYASRAGTILQYGEWEFIDDTKANISHWPGHDGKLVFSKKDISMGDCVGRYAPNRWGLHDMLGNVSEWCLDRYSSNFDLSKLGTVDPFDDGSGSSFRVVRGNDGETVFYRIGDARTASGRAIRLVIEIDDKVKNKVVEVK